jgi:predicted metal-dependent phosphoesterase TrpH
MKIDLHLHTNASDGRFTPPEIVKLCFEAGLKVIAITDHDTTDGIDAALTTASALQGMYVIPGVEINCDVPDGEVHILGYFLDYHNSLLGVEFARLRESRRRRGEKMVAKLNDLGLMLDWSRVQAIAGEATVCRPHVAQALLEKGLVTSTREAFDRYIGRNGPAYVEREKISPPDAVKLVKSAGGLPVLAHPADIANLSKLIDELVQAGLGGLEVYYASYDQSTKDRLLYMAAAHGLVISGGTDFHGLGSFPEGRPGDIEIPRRLVEDFFSRGGHDLEREVSRRS